MIAVDTSVWVDALRNAESSSARILTGLLDADEVALPLPVRLELLAGVAGRQRAGLRRALTALPVIRPDEDTWDRIGSFVERAAERGWRFGLADLLVAGLADQIGALAWSLDADFGRMETLNFVRRYEPPA